MMELVIGLTIKEYMRSIPSGTVCGRPWRFRGQSRVREAQEGPDKANELPAGFIRHARDHEVGRRLAFLARLLPHDVLRRGA